MRLQGWITKLAREKFSVKKVAAPTITILGLALAPASCFADTMYVFSGNITPYYFLPSGASQSFTYTGPDFITQGTFVPASALSECSTGYYATCGASTSFPLVLGMECQVKWCKLRSRMES